MSHADDGQENRFAGAIGEDYDATFRLVCPHLDRLEQSVADALARLSAIVGDRPLRVLDLGCGDGLTSRGIVNTIQSVNIVALDNEANMIRQIRENLSELGGAAISYVHSDALLYLRNCESNAFDGVGSCFVLHNCDEHYRREVIGEIHRVLRPHGLFVNADKVAQPEPLHGQTLLKQITLMIDTYLAVGRADLMREWVIHYLEDNIPGRLWFESDAVRDLRAAGFKKIEHAFRCDLEATLVALKT